MVFREREVGGQVLLVDRLQLLSLALDALLLLQPRLRDVEPLLVLLGARLHGLLCVRRLKRRAAYQVRLRIP